MSQDNILKYVTENPGCLQMELHIKIPMSRGDVADQVKRLVRKGEITRKPAKGNRKLTYKLYPVVPSSVTLDKRLFCDLRTEDPEFNKGKGDVFMNALNRSIIRGDFK